MTRNRRHQQQRPPQHTGYIQRHATNERTYHASMTGVPITMRSGWNSSLQSTIPSPARRRRPYGLCLTSIDLVARTVEGGVVEQVGLVIRIDTDERARALSEDDDTGD